MQRLVLSGACHPCVVFEARHRMDHTSCRHVKMGNTHGQAPHQQIPLRAWSHLLRGAPRNDHQAGPGKLSRSSPYVLQIFNSTWSVSVHGIIGSRYRFRTNSTATNLTLTTIACVFVRVQRFSFKPHWSFELVFFFFFTFLWRYIWHRVTGARKGLALSVP